MIKYATKSKPSNIYAAIFNPQYGRYLPVFTLPFEYEAQPGILECKRCGAIYHDKQMILCPGCYRVEKGKA